MESLRYLYKIGPGPSSSHTIGPKRISEVFLNEFHNAYSYKVDLFGSLALTGKGHLTDYIIEKTFKNRRLKINFIYEFKEEHPNTMDLYAYDKDGNVIGYRRAFSIGGGDFSFSHLDNNEQRKKIYPHQSMDKIIKYLKDNKISLSDYVYYYDSDIKEYLHIILDKMFDSIERGLKSSGKLPGTLNLERVASKIYHHALEVDDESERDKLLISAYAYAVNEENACAGEIVTAPTCGSSGVVPSLLYHFYKKFKTPKVKLVDALAVAGIIGNLVKRNATISGAEGGCQAEVGTACSMASSMVSYLFNLDIDKIEYAAEVAMEHHLGLTCDPVKGYVQIPCIERNAVAALRAYDAALFAKHIGNYRKNRVSFDQVIETMAATGKDLSYHYKETSLGGLAKHVKDE